MLKILVAAGALAALSVPALAQAPATAPAPATIAADPTSEQIASWIAGRHGEVQGADDAQPAKRDGQIHGEFGASIGSGGYKAGYGVATMPVGERGAVTVGVSDEHLGGGNRTYGPGYGYGGERRSLYIGLDLAGQGQGQAQGQGAASRCASSPGYRWGPSFGGADPACQAGAPAIQPER